MQNTDRDLPRSSLARRRQGRSALSQATRAATLSTALLACSQIPGLTDEPPVATFVVANGPRSVLCEADGSTVQFFNEKNCADAIEKWTNLVPAEVAEPGSDEALTTIVDLCNKATSPEPFRANVQPALADLYNQVRTELCFALTPPGR